MKLTSYPYFVDGHSGGQNVEITLLDPTLVTAARELLSRSDLTSVLVITELGSVLRFEP